MSQSTLAELKIGESATILSINNSFVSLKLMEMGIVPGETVLLDKIAPMGDPIAITISGYTLSLRKSEAASVLVNKN